MSALTTAFLAVVAMSWRAAFLILLLVALRFIFRRQIPPGMMFLGWLLLAGLLLMPFRLPMPWDPLGLGRTAKLRPAVTAVRFTEEVPLADQPEVPHAYRLEPSSAGTLARIAEQNINFDVFDVQVTTTRDYASVWAEIWLAGVAGLLALRMMAMLRLRRKLRSVRLPVTTELAEAVRRGCAALGVTRIPAIVVTPLVSTPALCGVISPQLLFPVGLADKLSGAELRWVVWHELGHLHRRDLWAQALLHAACAVHWFNPAVWLAARLARHDCELACDDFVLRRGGSDGSADYGHTLLKVLCRSGGKDRLPAGVGMVEGKRQLFSRIHMITNYRPQTLVRTFAGVALLAAFAVIGYTEEGKTPATTTAVAPTTPKSPVRKTPAELKAMAEAERAKMEKWEAEAKIVLRTIGTPGGVPVALFDVNDEPCLVTEGFELVASMVTGIDVENKRVTVTHRDQSKRVFDLTDPRPVKFPSFTPETIDAIIARHPTVRPEASMLPVPVLMAWNSINREGKEAILLNYLQGGMVIGIRSGPFGMGASSSFLFQKQISQRSHERMNAFLASLTPEQKAAFKGGAQMAIRITDAPEKREAQMAISRQQKTEQDKVVAGLSPVQRKLYDAWRGPARN